MPNFAQITLIGHVGRDPVVRTLSDQKIVANFSLAISEKVKGTDVTSWFDCSAWGKQAEVIGQYVTKGSPLCVVGRPRIETYQNKDGQEKTKVSVRISDFTMLGRKGDSPAQASNDGPSPAEAVEQARKTTAKAPAASSNDDEPPF